MHAMARGEAVAFARTDGVRSLAAWLTTALLTICSLVLTRHVQFAGASAWLAPLVLATVLATLSVRGDSLIVLPSLIYAALCWVMAMVRGVDTNDALRFLAIFWGVTLATQCRPRLVSLRWPLVPVILQAVVIVAVSAWLSVRQDEETSLAIRALAADQQWGDVYSHNGWYFKVQIVGNALIPLAWMLSVEKWRQRRWSGTWAVVLTLGLLAAGNLTYLLICGAYAVYQLYRMLEGRGRIALLSALVLASAVGASSTLIDETVAEKFDGADSSVGVRLDQFEVLGEAMAASPIAAVFGHGIGARYPNGRARAYSESQYIEVQILYIVYQIGVLGVLLLFGTLALALRLRMTRDGQLIFWAYIACGITNPYILDTNQMVATLILLATFLRE